MEGSPTDASSAVDADRGVRFDTSSYERLLRRVRDAGRRFVTFDDREQGVALHHDVVLSLDRALAMARLEATLRIEATYCVPLDAPVHTTASVTFAQTVRTLSQLGHDVGLRFQPHLHWDELPGDAAIRRRIRDRREVLGRLLDRPVEVVSFQQPTERLRNLDLEGAVNAASPPEGVPEYRCVTDRDWKERKPFREGVPERFRLLVRPGLWQPVERSESEIRSDYRQAAHERVDEYFESVASPPSVD